MPVTLPSLYWPLTLGFPVEKERTHGPWRLPSLVWHHMADSVVVAGAIITSVLLGHFKLVAALDVADQGPMRS